jgi:hypothetical protein
MNPDTEKQLDALESLGEKRMCSIEERHSFTEIVSTVSELPKDVISGAISLYQKIIRQNVWYFPTLHDVDLEMFLVRWGKVHESYFETAEEIFKILLNDKSLSSLATAGMLAKVIQSETMRGWVGKRSPVGLDSLLDARIAQLCEILSSLDESEIDDVLSYGGIYSNKINRMTAESEVVSLFADYHREVGRDLALDMLANSRESTKKLLRYYCRYSINEFNDKYRSMRDHLNSMPNLAPPDKDASAVVAKRLNHLTDGDKTNAWLLLAQIRQLNFLNLNLEVKYSFKGWAGLMHVLVFIACKAILMCYASLFSERCLSQFKAKQDLSYLDSRMSVLIQEMCNADLSAVVMTRDPVEGGDTFGIEITYGACESLVSGSVQGDLYLLSRATGQVMETQLGTKTTGIWYEPFGDTTRANKVMHSLPDELRNRYAAPNRLIDEIYRLSMYIEGQFHTPQDIELVVDRDEIIVVQTRPITACA